MKDLFVEVLFRWRLGGALAWHTFLMVFVFLMYHASRDPTSIILSPWETIKRIIIPSSQWLSFAYMGMCMTPATVMHGMVLSFREPHQMFPSWTQYLPRTVAIVLRKGMARCEMSVEDTMIWIGYWAIHTVSAMLMVMHFQSGSFLGVVEIGYLAACLAMMHMIHVIYWSRDICKFPSLQRHRYFRMKQQLPKALELALSISMSGIALFFLIAFLNGSIYRILYLANLLSMLRISWMCSFSWITATVVMEVIFSERLKSSDYGSMNVLQTQQKWLNTESMNITYNSTATARHVLALHDLSWMASETGKGSWKREQIFLDDSGNQWRQTVAECMSILLTVTEKSQAAMNIYTMPLEKDKKADADGGLMLLNAVRQTSKHETSENISRGSKWNRLPSGIVRPSPTKGHRGLLLSCIGYVSLECERSRLAARALADLAIASFKEDRYGVLQLGEPSLGSLLLCLLECSLCLKYLCKHAEGCIPEIGPCRNSGDSLYGYGDALSALHALLDELNVCILSMGTVFGLSLEHTLKTAKKSHEMKSSQLSEAEKLLSAKLREELGINS